MNDLNSFGEIKMTIDLTKLREKELRNYSFQETLSVITALEDIKPLRFSKIEALETLETYCLFVYIIKERIENNEFNERSERAHV